MLHYNPRHVSSINMPIFRRANCIITASGIITLCKRLYGMPDESIKNIYVYIYIYIYILFFEALIRHTHSVVLKCLQELKF